METIRNNRRNLLAAGALVGSLLLGGCGEDSIDTEVTETTSGTDAVLKAEYFDPLVLEDGRRVTRIPPAEGEGSYTGDIFLTETCNGTRDLHRITEQWGAKARAGGIDISENHEWCQDGRITESDFPN